MANADLTPFEADVVPFQRHDLHGVAAEFDDWHFNVRQSNTEPLLRLNLEGLTPEIMEKRRDEVLASIRTYSHLSSLRNKVRRRVVRAPEGAAR